MMRSLLLRGMVAGLIAATAGFAVSRGLGEPQVERAIGFESSVGHHGHHQAAEKELVRRPVQRSFGLGTGVVLFGVALGGLFSLAFAFNYGRIANLGARGTALLLGVLGLVSA